MYELFLKECKMLGRSLVYFIFIGVVFVFCYTQFFQEIPLTKASKEVPTNVKNQPPFQREVIQEPIYVEDFEAYFTQHQKYPYGTVNEEIPEQVIPKATSRLFSEYKEGSYIAYPMGLARNVKLKSSETEKIEEALEEITGKSIDELQQIDRNGKWSEVLSSIDINYDRFKVLMEEVGGIIGTGSNYSKENLTRLGERPRTYEEALKEYKDLVEVDKITGGYARLFSDYSGIVLGLFPIFVVVFYMLRDKKSNMYQLIYYRDISSFKLILSRYLALVSMMMLPVLVLAVISTIKFIGIGNELEVSIDYLAFVKYSLGWLMPTVMAVTALGMFITVLTDSILAILVQVVWFFIALFSAGLGGNYGIIQLIIRFNSSGDRKLFLSNISNILINRIFYVILSAVLLTAAVYVFKQKRLGRIDIYGKFRKHSSGYQSKFKDSISE